MASLVRDSFRRVLRKIGLEPRGRARELTVRLGLVEQRLIVARQMRDRGRGGMLRWKDKYRLRKERDARQAVANARIKVLEQEVARLTAALRKCDEQQVMRLADLETHVADAERALRVERDHVDAIEVKLDLVDGAINTLDRRYRTVVTGGARVGT